MLRRILAIIAFMIATGYISGPPSVLLTVYDPLLGGMNCDEDCYTLADGHKWTLEDYENVAACPTWMVFTGNIKTGLSFGSHDVICRDTGPDVRVRWNDYYESYVIHIDVMYPIHSMGYPEWNYVLIPLDEVDFYVGVVE